MPSRVRVDLANPAELLELPGVGPEQAEAIPKFRVEHGPIQDARQLATILRAWSVAEAIRERVEVDPSDTTAPRGAWGIEPRVFDVRRMLAEEGSSWVGTRT